MSESEQHAILGKAVMEHDRARRTLDFLFEDANKRSFACLNLSATLRGATAQEIVRDLEKFLALQKKENFDWSKLTVESLSQLASGLKTAIEDEKETAEAERRLRR